MLVELSIRNFALLKEVNLKLTSGLNILTGETGAGKSIIIKALDMLVGGRASTDFIRTGEDKSIIEASFNLKDNIIAKEEVEKLGIDLAEDDNIILTREISHSGNNKARINGRIVTLEIIREISKYLIDIHGQHEHQSLLNSEEHIRLLDQFGGEDLLNLKDEVKIIYNKLQKKKAKLEELNYDQRERERRIDLLQFQMDEIEEAQLELGEEETLLLEKKRLANSEELSRVISRTYTQLYESDFEAEAVIDQISQLVKEIEGLVKLDSNLDSVAQTLKEINYSLEEVSFELRDYQDRIEFNPQRLNIVGERLNLINDLKRKYGDNIKEILEYYDKISVEFEELNNNEVYKDKLEKEVKKLEESYLIKAEELSEVRGDIARLLEKKIIKELRDLSMMQTEFKVNIKKREGYSNNGIDRVEFLIAPNPGSQLKSLSKIASGGELSRIMLALKTIIADIDGISTLIFDEIDTGIGGRVAKLVADKLILLSNKHQVICITHLPQIACMADNHYLIMKKVVNDKTTTVLHSLNDNARIREVARMLDGSLNDITMGHAQKLIQMSDDKKRRYR